MTILSPAGEEELFQMLQWALSHSGPVMIRYPKSSCPAGDPAFFFPLEEGRGVYVRRQPEANVCIMFSGGLYPEVMASAEILEQKGICTGKADLYNLRFLKPVDEEYLAEVFCHYEVVIIAEEGITSGGFGEYAAELAIRFSCSCKLLVIGVREKFDALGKRDELLSRNGLDAKSIAETVSAAIAGKKAVDSVLGVMLEKRSK